MLRWQSQPQRSLNSAQDVLQFLEQSWTMQNRGENQENEGFVFLERGRSNCCLNCWDVSIGCLSLHNVMCINFLPIEILVWLTQSLLTRVSFWQLWPWFLLPNLIPCGFPLFKQICQRLSTGRFLYIEIRTAWLYLESAPQLSPPVAPQCSVLGTQWLITTLLWPTLPWCGVAK